MTVVLGVDSGGSKTLAALVSREGQLLAWHEDEGLDPNAVENWRERLRALPAHLDVTVRNISAGVLGMPYHGELPQISAEQSRCAAEVFGPQTLVENDVRIAFDGAFGGGAGALILSGTGSMAWASLSKPGSPHIRVGGWGDLFGDEGSAYWIGRRSLARVARELDGRSQATGFSREVLEALSIDGEELIDWCYRQRDRRKAIAGLSRTTAALAGSGDEVAREILDAAGNALAETLTAAWRRAAGDAPMRWSFAGGVARNEIIQSRIEARVGCAPVPPILPPLGGALLRAGLAAGWEIAPHWVETVGAAIKARMNGPQS